MRIGIISDSHGKRTALTRAINRLGKIDIIFHLGDLYTDAIYIENTYNIKTVYVKGNCDFSQDTDIYKEVELEGKRFFLTHGHMYRVKWGIQYLVQVTSVEKYDMVLFGHTHIPQVSFESGIIFMNPGSSADPRAGKKPTVGLVEISRGRILPYIVNIDD
jgi:putative phosphoesterase